MYIPKSTSPVLLHQMHRKYGVRRQDKPVFRLNRFLPAADTIPSLPKKANKDTDS